MSCAVTVNAALNWDICAGITVARRSSCAWQRFDALVIGPPGGLHTGGMEPAEAVPGLLGYAGRLHALAGREHHVVSPLGAWLLVALCAPLAGEQAGRELAEVLGAAPARAAALAARLLAEPHPLVAAGAGGVAAAGLGDRAVQEPGCPAWSTPATSPARTRPTAGRRGGPWG